jgi:cytochrome bd ubiquinol oxidase subunit I
VLKHVSETSEKKLGMVTSEGLAEGPQEYQRRGEFA